MAETTIEWTATPLADGTMYPGYTFNPWIGCSKVHEGCKFCYAERDWDKRRHVAQWGPNGTRVLTSEENWAKPGRWNKAAAAAGIRAKVFCASLADVFEDWPEQMRLGSGYANNAGKNGAVDRFASVSLSGGRSATSIIDARRRLFALIDATPNLDWLLLTKRPENIRMMMFDPDSLDGWESRENVWLGTSISNQETAEKQIPELLKCRELSPVLFLSAEPLLGSIDFSNVTAADGDGPWGLKWIGSGTGIDWVICGGESGHGARPMHPQWASSLRDQCVAAGVPFHFKQHGEWAPVGQFGDFMELCETKTPLGWMLPDGSLDLEYARSAETSLSSDSGAWIARVGKKAAGRLLDGRTWDQFPEPVHV